MSYPCPRCDHPNLDLAHALTHLPGEQRQNYERSMRGQPMISTSEACDLMSAGAYYRR
ncbi:hypothetical protein [Nocardia sp. NPDC059195]|uniref:hypothetical protein n=1 Tax=Nocardia sp. NPDC059195 TaxID=3346765 RepID=UPI0036A66846